MALKLSGSFVTKKTGPLPNWAWMLIGLGAVVIWKSIVANKRAGDKAKEQATGDGEADVQLVGGNQTPPVVFQSYTTTITPITVPPGGGRETPPMSAPWHHAPGRPRPPEPTPTPSPTPTPATPAPPSGQWVTVSKFTTKNPPWNSTLSGIAKQTKGNANLWTAIWNDAANASLRTRRKDPKYIQPGDRIFVPA